jgi:hypothetical protein
MPIHYSGGMYPISYGGTFTLERILGTVPVEPDGSAYFELPALRPVFFVALDENDLSVKRMQSFLSVMPGELTSCAGCHEQRPQTPASSGYPGAALQALRRPPSRIEPVRDAPDVIDFPRDVQPVLDRHCAGCHSYDRPGGGVVLTGDRGPTFSHSYLMLTIRRQLADGRNLPKSNYPPRTLGSSASPLMKKVLYGHNGVNLTPRERTLIRLWIESGAAYAGTYAALGTGTLGEYTENILERPDVEWPGAQASARAIERRCGSCHAGHLALPLTATHEPGRSRRPPGSKPPRWPLSRQLLYNLTRPEKSILLLAPLAREAGGWGVCQDAGGAPVFTAVSDPDYRTILEGVTEAARWLDGIKRFDMPGFRPRGDWVREMERYGILEPGTEPSAVADVYAVERRYWESLWYRPE